MNTDYKEIKDFLNEETDRIDREAIIDKKFYDENYIPTPEDVKNFTEDQARELYDNNRMDFTMVDDSRDYDISVGKWSIEDENNLEHLRNRYMITRKLLEDSGKIQLVQ